MENDPATTQVPLHYDQNFTPWIFSRGFYNTDLHERFKMPPVLCLPDA